MDLKALKKLRDDRGKLSAKATKILDAAAARDGAARALTTEERAELNAIKAELASVDELIAEGEAMSDEVRAAAASAIARSGDPAAPTIAGGLQAMASAVLRGGEPVTSLLGMRAGRFTGFGDYLQAMASTALARSGRSGFEVDERIGAMEASTGRTSTDVPSDGGLMVGLQYLAPMLGRAWGQGQVLSRVSQQPVGDGFDGISMPRPNEASRKRGKRWGGIDIFWPEDGSPVTATKPDWVQDEIRVKPLRGLVRIPERLLRDATALGGYVLNAFPKEFVYVIERAIFRGSGKGQPLGILNSPAKIKITKESGQAVDTFVAQNAMKMMARVLPGSRTGTDLAWFMNIELEPQLWQMFLPTGASSGQLIYMPQSGLSGSPYATLGNRSVIPIEQCSAIGDEGDIALLDLSEYLLVTKGLMQMMESVHFYFDTHDMAIRFEQELNGQPILDGPITPEFGTGTLAPFITLENR